MYPPSPQPANGLFAEHSPFSQPRRSRCCRTLQFRRKLLQPGHLFFNRYEVIKRVGGGGMGNVYQARDLRLSNRYCALKEMIDLYSDPAEHDRTLKEFEREASLLSALRHPAIPAIYDYFIEGDKYYLAMEYVDGMDMNKFVKQYGEKLPESKVIKVAMQVCDVLHYLHTHKPPIIYRDLKPSNIMLTQDDRVVLIDFGIARFLTANLSDITTIGTMGFVPPEVYEEKIEPASDIYSLGATLFYFLTGVSPQTKPIIIFDFSKNPHPQDYNPDMSPEMNKIVLDCVAYNARNRFPSAYALKREMEKLKQKYFQEEKSEPSLLTLLNRKRNKQEQRARVVPVREETNRVEVPGRTAPPTEFEQFKKEFEEEFKDFLPMADDVIRSDPQTDYDIYCVKCLNPLSENDHICPNCGTEHPHSPFIKVSKAVLKLDSERQTFNLVKDISLIGRKDVEKKCFPEVDVTPYDPGKHVSRLHVRVLKLNGEYYVEDLKSKNRVVINGRYVLQPGATHKLNSGDTLKVGRLVFTFIKE